MTTVTRADLNQVQEQLASALLEVERLHGEIALRPTQRAVDALQARLSELTEENGRLRAQLNARPAEVRPIRVEVPKQEDAARIAALEAEVNRLERELEAIR